MHMDEIRRIASRIIPHRSRSRSLSRRERRRRASDATDLEEEVVAAVPNSTDVHDRTTTDSPSPPSPPSGAVTVRTFLAETPKEFWLGDYCFQDVLGTDGTHVGRVHLGELYTLSSKTDSHLKNQTQGNEERLLITAWSKSSARRKWYT